MSTDAGQQQSQQVFENFVRNQVNKTIDNNKFQMLNKKIQQQQTYTNNNNNNNKINNNLSTSPSTSNHPKSSNTILITHNYSKPDVNDLKSELIKQNINQSSSSITIVTHNNTTSVRDISTTNSNGEYHHVSMEKMHPILNNGNNDSRVGSPVIVDSINICINNHFNEMGIKTKINDNCSDIMTKFIKKEKSDELITEPDSTTSNNNVSFSTNTITKDIPICFDSGMDVLVQKKDTKYYLGTIIAVYPLKARCWVKFDDGSEYWAKFDELTQLSNSTNDLNSDPMCVICKKINKNDIVELCKRCGRGCHRLCAESGYNNGIWSCKRCTAENGSQPERTEIKLNISQLPYELNALNWDDKHRVNEEQIYCYCGKTGRWEKKMLQCIKCQQWFHDKCIDCLKYPLYNGDRFYIFACSNCNNGVEFVRRLEMKWSDIVHLILFILTTNNHDKKYHHITKSIVPFAIENWCKLQLPNSINKMSPSEIKDNILKTLTIHKNRFKSCREIKKNNSFWGLRSRIPAAPPKITIPIDVELNDQYIKQNLKIHTISPKSLSNYKRKSDSSSSNDLKFSSEDEIPIKQIITKNKKINKPINQKLLPKKKIPKNNIEIKKNLIKIKTNKIINLQRNLNQESHNKINMNKKIELGGTLTIDNNINCNTNICDSSDETSSLGTLDLIIPPPKNFQGRNNPFRFTPKKNETNYNKLKNNLNINKNFDISSKLVALKKSSGGGFLNCSGGIGTGTGTDFQAAGQFRIVRTIKRRLSAKDLVIGPNMEVKRRRLRRSSGNVEVISTTIEAMPRKLNNYLPLIRQESSIFKQSHSIIASSSSSSSSSNTPIATTPTILESAASNLFNSTSNLIDRKSDSHRNLRKRQDKNYSENPRRNSNSSVSTNCSSTNGIMPTISGSINPIENDTTLTNNSKDNTTNTTNATTKTTATTYNQNNVSISELQTSVNMYFGAIERIKNGEKFTVKAKRKLLNGKTQYLVEWDVGGMSTLNQ